MAKAPFKNGKPKSSASSSKGAKPKASKSSAAGNSRSTQASKQTTPKSRVTTGRVPKTGGGLVTSRNTTGSVPNVKRVSKPSSISGASIESLMKVMIMHLASIDETLKKQLEFTKSKSIQEQQTQREIDYERNGVDQAELIKTQDAAGMDSLGGDLLKTGLLAAFLAIPNLLKDATAALENRVQQLNNMAKNPENVAIAAGAAVAGTAAYKVYADRRNAKVDAAPHTKESVAGRQGAKSPLTAAELDRLKKQNIGYNQQTGRYHEIKPDGKPGKMISNEAAAKALEKGKPTFKLPAGPKALSRIGGAGFAVALESIDYATGAKEANKENLVESAGGVTGGLAGAAALGTAGLALGPVGGFVGAGIGYFGGDILGRTVARRFMRDEQDGEVSPNDAAGSTGSNKERNVVNPKEIAKYLKEKGVSDVHAAGMLVNIREESAYNSAALGDDGNSGGLFQYNGARFQQMKRFAGHNWQQNWKGQIDYALSEPDSHEYLATQFSNPKEAASWFLTNWERPAEVHVAQRLARIDKQAERAMNTVVSADEPNLLPAMNLSEVSVPRQPTPAANLEPPEAPPPTPVPDDRTASFIFPNSTGRPQSIETSGRDSVPSPNMFDPNQDWALYFN